MTSCRMRRQSKRYALRYSSKLPGTYPTCQFIQTEYTIDFLDKHDYYHVGVIRSNLIRNIPTIFKDVYDELLLALNDSIPTVSEGVWRACWKLFRVHEEGRVG